MAKETEADETRKDIDQLVKQLDKQNPLQEELFAEINEALDQPLSVERAKATGYRLPKKPSASSER